MKKIYYGFTFCFLASAMLSCNNSSSTSDTTSDSSKMTSTAPTSDSMNATNNGAATTNTTNMNTTPLSKEDSMFVMKAAAGGMAEVEMGNMAQMKGNSQRVKDFGAMMVRDHSMANDELKSFASSRGITLPSALPADMQKHMDAMQKLSGKGFDQHYVDMMVNDHKEDISQFKKAAATCNDQELKTWAGKTLPTLQTHLDSIQSIRKMKM